MSKVVRSVKNVTKGYSSVQVKVRNATSNDPWGPTGTDMADIAAMTFNSPSDFYEIMDMLDKRLNDKGKNWRHVLKSLKVLDYCLHEGSELVVTWSKKNVYIIKTLREFIYVDEEGRDVGQNVRVSAKELTSLILDEERLRSERSDRKLWKSRVSGIDEGPSAIAGGSEPRSKNRRPHREADEDAEMRLALEASKYEAEEEKKRRERAAQNAENDDDLAKAIKLSKEEEERRRQELENNNASSLFDDLPPAQPQATGFNQGYQQQPAVDWFGNPMEPQQPQSTGFLNQQYAQQTGYQQPQQTGYYQNGFGAQPTGYDQFAQQQQQQFLQPQQTAFNPYAQQQQQQDIFAPQQQQQLQPGSHNPWASQQQPDALKPMPTGSNNPFAQQSAFGRQPTTPQRQQPTLSSLSEQKTATQFNSQNPITNFQPTPQPNPITSFQPRPQSQPQQQPQDPHHARLNALLASGEGQDTFGNTGDLRIPAQHTAPGTFVNSAGAGLNRLHSTPTGTNNPFLQSQFTGMPTAQYQQTAQTGMGKPWGGQQGQQQQQQQHGGFGAQGGSLIDL